MKLPFDIEAVNSDRQVRSADGCDAITGIRATLSQGSRSAAALRVTALRGRIGTSAAAHPGRQR